MEASATVLHFSSRNRLLIKCGESIGTNKADRDVLKCGGISNLQSPASPAATAGVLPPASDRDPSPLVQSQTASHVAAC